MAAAQGTCRFCGQQILVEDGEGMRSHSGTNAQRFTVNATTRKCIKKQHFGEIQQNGALTSYSEKERANTDSQTK